MSAETFLRDKIELLSKTIMVIESVHNKELDDLRDYYETHLAWRGIDPKNNKPEATVQIKIDTDSRFLSHLNDASLSILRAGLMSNRARKNRLRDVDIFIKYKSNKVGTYSELGREYGITGQRIREVVKKQTRVLFHPSRSDLVKTIDLESERF